MKTDEIKIYNKYEGKSNQFRIRPIWLRNFLIGITNLIKWLPTIWNDRNWDDYFIFEILKKKLILQRQKLIDDNNFTSTDQVNRDITVCLNLIERFQQNFYETEYQTFCEQDFKFEPTSDNSDICRLIINTVYEDYDGYFKKYQSSIRKMKLKQIINTHETDKDRIAIRLSMYNHQKCRNLLFKILNERIECWWD